MSRRGPLLRVTPPALALTLLALSLLATACAGTDNAPTLSQPTSVTQPSTPASAPSSPASTPADSPTPTATAPASTLRPLPSPSPSEPDAYAPMIVIDPGHSGRSIRSTDAETGLQDIDYPNYPEIYEMFDVSYCLGQALRKDGYRVTLTKAEPLASIGLRQRAAMADNVNADLAISVHDDHSQSASFQATYSQLGIYGHAMYRGRGDNRTVFKHKSVAKKSAKYAKVIASQRTKVQKHKVSIRENIYTGRAPLEPGNLALVQLLSDVPWVYNEMGALTNGNPTTAMSISSEHGYAKGLLLGVEAAVPLNFGRVDQPSAGAQGLRRCLIDRIEPDSGKARPKRYLPAGF